MKSFLKAMLPAAFLILGATPALAHGDLAATVPPKGSTLPKPVDHLAITFSQAPTKDAVVKVVDGCDRNVVKRVDLQDRVAHVYLSDPQPGKWQVSYNIISSVDGHPSRDAYNLTVKGKPDCSKPKPDEGKNGDKDDEGDGPNAADGDSPVPEDNGSSFPVVPVAIGTVAVLGVAFAVRRAAG